MPRHRPSLSSSPRKVKKKAVLSIYERFNNQNEPTKHAGGRKGAWEGVQDDSPLKKIPKQGTKRAREPYIPPKAFAATEQARPSRRGTKTGMPKMRPPIEDEEFYPIIHLNERQLDALEAKWLAVKTFTERRSREKISNKADDKSAQELLKTW